MRRRQHRHRRRRRRRARRLRDNVTVINLCESASAEMIGRVDECVSTYTPQTLVLSPLAVWPISQVRLARQCEPNLPANAKTNIAIMFHYGFCVCATRTHAQQARKDRQEKNTTVDDASRFDAPQSGIIVLHRLTLNLKPIR